MRCLLTFIGILTAIVILILFDWLNARALTMDFLSSLQHSVEVLSEWGDNLQKALGLSQDAATEAQTAVEKAKAAVEKISE